MSPEELLGEEEHQFLGSFLATGDRVRAARGTLVDEDASRAVARQAANRALEAPEVKSVFVQAMDRIGLSIDMVAQAIMRNLTAEKNVLYSGENGYDVVSLGDDGLVQLKAAELAMKAMDALSGGPASNKAAAQPATLQPLVLNFNTAPLDDEPEIKDVYEGTAEALP